MHCYNKLNKTTISCNFNCINSISIKTPHAIVALTRLMYLLSNSFIFFLALPKNASNLLLQPNLVLDYISWIWGPKIKFKLRFSMIFLRSYVHSKMLHCVQAQFLSSKADATMALKSIDWNCANRFYFSFWPVSVVQPSNVVQYRWRITYFLIIPTKVIHSNSILWW